MVEISIMQMCILWSAAIILFSIVEAVTAQLVSIWFVAGSAAALIAALCHTSLYEQLIIFITVAVLALVITRPLVKKYIRPKKEHTNADRVLNQTGIVIEEINNVEATGQVRVDGKIWTARSSDGTVIPKNSIVKPEKISGVKLIVNIK